MVVATVCFETTTRDWIWRSQAVAGGALETELDAVVAVLLPCVRACAFVAFRACRRPRKVNSGDSSAAGRRIERQASSSVSRSLSTSCSREPAACRRGVAWCLFCPLCLAAARYKREELRGAQRKSRANPILASTPPPLLAPALRPTPGPSDTLDSLDSTRLRTRQRAQKASCLPFPTTTTNH